MKNLIGKVYKKGFARIKVTKNYSFEHVTVLKWAPNTKPTFLVITKEELNSWRNII